MLKSWNVLAGVLSAVTLTAMSPVVGWAGTTLLDLQTNYTNTRLGADSLGNLNQDYAYIDVTGGSPVTMTNNGTSWSGVGGSSISATTMTPGINPTNAHGIAADRIWQAGETLNNLNQAVPGVSEAGIVTIAGTVTVTGTGADSFVIIRNSDLAHPLYQSAALSAASGTVSYSVAAFQLNDGDFLNFALVPTGASPPTAAVTGAVVLVPEPATLGLAALGLPLLLRLRRVAR